MRVLDGWIVGREGVRRGRVRFGERIERVEADGAPRPAPSDDAPRILPGFVDVHVHGGAGGDTMDGPEGVRTLARHHLAHGTTTLLPTTITQTWPAVMAALRGVAEVVAEARGTPAANDANDATGAARAVGAALATLPDLPGAHLEGPFISPERLGAQPPHAVPPTPERVREVLDAGVVRLVTIAPELDGAIEAARAFARAGVRVSVGHTRADAERVARLARAVREEGGTVGFTHLFNAMGGMAGRDPGIVGAALADREAYAELILDGHHVHDVAFLAAHAAKPERLQLITDAMRACGLGDGPTELGGQRVVVRGGAARLEDGSLAGSVLTLDAAVRRAVAAGLPLGEASALASAVPAAYLGLADRGTLAPGLRSDIAVVDADLRVRRVYVAGREAGAPG